ncbi:MAG: flagellin [Planctomycetota bacterium]|nr:flagellin [Planctomycetota bacterium]
MSVINTNVSSLIAQRSLSKNNQALTTSLQRLSTGLKINSGKDDPAGLIASQALLAEQAGIQTAINNAGRAGNVIGTAEGGLNEVSSLLTQLQGLVGQAANSGGLSSGEVAANQLQVDSILSTINRVAQGTTFEGRQLLNGNLSYTTSSLATSALGNVQVNSALVPSGGTVAVAVQVVASGKTGAITYTGGTIAGSTVTLQVAGNQGTTQLSFASGTTVSSIATAINGVKASTGLSAQVSGTALRVNSTGFGSSQFVSISALTGTFSGLSANKTFGKDANVTVNGATAQTDGLNVSYRNANLDVSLTLTQAFDKPGTKTFYVTGGGATFALGSKVSDASNASIGIGSVSTGSLGDSINGFLNSLGSGGANNLSSTTLSTAQNILTSAISQVSSLRGRLGAFQTFTIGSTVNSLGVAFENVSAAQSSIADTNFAQETSNLTRAQILSQSAQTVLAQANAIPQQALNLLKNA